MHEFNETRMGYKPSLYGAFELLNVPVIQTSPSAMQMTVSRNLIGATSVHLISSLALSLHSLNRCK